MIKIREFLRQSFQGRARGSSPSNTPFLRLGEQGFTLLEALMALGVLAIGVVGLMLAARKLTTGHVATWKRQQMVQIAQARMEEQKAAIYQNYQPDMRLPVVVPTQGATLITFSGSPITFASVDALRYDCVANSMVTQLTGYGLTYPPTPGWNASNYYGPAASPTPGPANLWQGLDPIGDPCSHEPRNIGFEIDVPPNSTGQLALAMVDAGARNRSQQVQVNGLIRADYNPSGVTLSTSAASPSVHSFAVSRFDTQNGKLGVTIRHSGNPNDWGYVLEDGNNQRGFSLTCPEQYPPSATPTRTPTRTHTPSGGSCSVGTRCWTILANDSDIIRSNFSLNNSTGTSNDYIYPNNTNGSAYYEFTAANSGWFQVGVSVRSNTASGTSDNSLDVAMTAGGVTLSGSNVNFGASEARWEHNSTSFVEDFVSHRGSGTDGTPQYNPAQWFLTAGTTYRLYFMGAEATNYLRVNAFWLYYVTAAATPTPTSSPTPPPTATVTPTIQFCTFPSVPTPGSVSGNFTGLTEYTCSANNKVMAVVGVAGVSQICNLFSAPLVEDQDGVTVAGLPVDYPAKIYADVHLSPGNSVAMRAVFISGSPAAVTLTGSAPGGGWVTLGPGTIAAGRRIDRVYFDYANLSSSSNNYLGVDSIRVIYDSVQNPNAVLSEIRLSTVSSFRDSVRYLPYIVDTLVEPMDNTASAEGYMIQVNVYQGVNKGNPTQTPTWVPDNRYKPVTLMNSVSP